MSAQDDRGRLVRVVIVDDHLLVRDLLRQVLDRAPGITVVGAASNGADALRLVEEQRPDVLLLDTGLPGASVLDVARQIHARGPATTMIMFMGYETTDWRRGLAHLGVQAYLCRATPVSEIVAAVRSVALGRGALESETLERAMASGPALLTRREHEVLELLAAGYSNREIAEALFVAPTTVEYHLAGLFRKLGVRRRTQAISRGRQYGLIPAMETGETGFA